MRGRKVHIVAGAAPDHGLEIAVGERAKRAVVGRWAEPAREEHVRDVGVVQLAADLLDDLFRPVANLRHSLDRIAQETQTLRHPMGVGVEGEAADQLVADGHDA